MDDLIQTIRTPSGDELVVMPREVYEDLIDTRAAGDARAALGSGEEELLSEEEVRELLESRSALGFWRRKRHLHPDTLAEALGTSEEKVREIESGKRPGGIRFYQRAARVLRVPLDAILPDDEEDHDPEPA